MTEPPIPAADNSRWMARLRGTGATFTTSVVPLFAAVTLGFSQIFLDVIQRNLEYFPGNGWFHLWTLLLVQWIPLSIVLLVDRCIARSGPDRRLFRFWRTGLYVMTLLSFLRQLVCNHLYTGSLGWGGRILLSTVPPFLGGWLCYRMGTRTDKVFAWMAILALIPTGGYVVRSGVWGPAWLRVTEANPSGPANSDAPPVFIIVFDELSLNALRGNDGENVDPVEFPAFSALERESAWFSQATTNSAWTGAVLPVLLSGKHSPVRGDESIFHRIRISHESHAIEPYIHPNPALWPADGYQPSLCLHGRNRTNAHSALETLEILVVMARDTLPVVPGMMRAALRLFGEAGLHGYTFREFGILLRAIRKENVSGQLWYWHCTLPHCPYVYNSEGILDPAPGREYLPHDGGDHPEIWARYRNQVKLADRLLGRILAQLKAEDLYDRCVLVVTSDHGIRTWGSREPPGFPSVRSGMTPQVPLAIRAPGLPAGRRETDYQPVDLAPTLLDLLELPYAPADFDGVSALDAKRPSRFKIFQDESHNSYRYDPSSLKWILQ